MIASGEKFERPAAVGLGVAMRSPTRRRHRPPLPLRRQKLPELVQPHGHVPLDGFGIASCAPWDGRQ
jgi:hypothetical protein